MCMVLYLFSWFTATGVCVQVETQPPPQQVCMFNVYTLHVTCVRSGFIAYSLTKQLLQTLGNDFVLLILLAYVISIYVS